MPSPKYILNETLKFLKQKPFFSTFPSSLLLIGLEELIEKQFFSCPCKYEQNALLTASIFTGPTLFIFALMFFCFRAFKQEWFHCDGNEMKKTEKKKKTKKMKKENEENDDEGNDELSDAKVFAYCLFPPLMWVIILLFDGDYVACGMTDWKGVYGFDKELSRSWCKPTRVMRNEAKLRDLNGKYIYHSQFAGYIMVAVFSFVAVILIVIYNCCISKKCDSCSKQLSCGRRTAEPQSEGQGDDHEPESVPLGTVNTSSSTSTV